MGRVTTARHQHFNPNKPQKVRIHTQTHAHKKQSHASYIYNRIWLNRQRELERYQDFETQKQQQLNEYSLFRFIFKPPTTFCVRVLNQTVDFKLVIFFSKINSHLCYAVFPTRPRVAQCLCPPANITNSLSICYARPRNHQPSFRYVAFCQTKR